MDIVGGFRGVIQDLLVPELKALQVEIKHLQDGLKKNTDEIALLRQEMTSCFEKSNTEANIRFETHTEEMSVRFEKFTQEINARFEKHTEEMNARFEKFTQEINARFENLIKEMNARFETVTKELSGLNMNYIKMVGTMDVIVTKLEFIDRLGKLERTVDIIKRKLDLDAA